MTYASSISDSGGGLGRGGRALARDVDIVVKVRVGGMQEHWELRARDWVIVRSIMMPFQNVEL